MSTVKWNLCITVSTNYTNYRQQNMLSIIQAIRQQADIHNTRTNFLSFNVSIGYEWFQNLATTVTYLVLGDIQVYILRNLQALKGKWLWSFSMDRYNPSNNSAHVR